MNQQMAQAAISFLNRVELKGSEAATLVQVQGIVARIAQGELVVVNKQDYDALLADKRDADRAE